MTPAGSPEPPSHRTPPLGRWARARSSDTPRGRISLPGWRSRAGLGLLLLLVLLAAGGPYLSRWDWHRPDVGAFGAAPSARHWLGTTPAGRDMCAVTLRGLRRSLAVGLFAAAGATGLAAVLGTVAGYLGGWADRGLTSVTDVLLVFPPFLIAAVLSPVLGGHGWPALATLLAGLMWMTTARAVRGVTASLRERDHVLAARALGATAARIVRCHVLPDLMPLLAADATLNAGAAVAAETGLSCFGFGVRPPDVSLGTLIADGAPAATVFPWLFLPPVALLILLVLAVALLAGGPRDTTPAGRHRW